MGQADPLLHETFAGRAGVGLMPIAVRAATAIELVTIVDPPSSPTANPHRRE